MTRGAAVVINWIPLYVVFNIATLSINGDDNLALSSNGASCLVGGYTQMYNDPCTAVIDGTVLSYKPKPGNGWILITLPIVARVTSLDMVFSNTASNDSGLHLRIMASDIEDEGINIIGLPRGEYYQPFIFRTRVVTNYITITWQASQMPDIRDIRIFGNTEAMTKIAPMSMTCDNFQESACGYVGDNNLLTTMFLASGTTLQLQFQSTEELTHIAFYSHGQRPESALVPVTVTLLSDDTMNNETVEIEFRNQGWKQLASWQIKQMPRPYSTPATVTIVAKEGTFAALSEVQFYHVEPDDNAILPDVPTLGYHVDNMLRTVFLGTLSTTPSPVTTMSTTPSPVTTMSTNVKLRTTSAIVYTTAHYDDIDYTYVEDFDGKAEPIVQNNSDTTTTLDNQLATSIVLTTVGIPEAVTRLITDLTSAGSSLEHTSRDNMSTPAATRSAPFQQTLTTVGDLGESHRTSLPRWFWYLVIAVGVIVIVLVVALIITMSRMRTRKYRLNTRPTVLVRGMSNTSHAMSVTTPTRGYFHLTLNSQSSILEPYSGVSPVNTTTFGRKKSTVLPGYAESNGKNYQSEGTGTETTLCPLANEDVDELSDDCFEP